MTTRLTRPMLALAFAAALIAGFSNPSHAALSSAERAAPAATAPAPETFAATATSPATASDVAATPAAVKAAPVTAAAAPVVEKRKTTARKAPRAPAFAASSFGATGGGYARGGGYPCH